MFMKIYYWLKYGYIIINYILETYERGVFRILAYLWAIHSHWVLHLRRKLFCLQYRMKGKFFSLGVIKNFSSNLYSLLAIQNEMKNFLVGVGVIKYFSSNLLFIASDHVKCTTEVNNRSSLIYLFTLSIGVKTY